MASRQKTWTFAPSKAPRPKVPEELKAEVAQKSQQFLERVLKPKYIKKPRPNEKFNYVADVFTKWRQGFLYFCATYHCPGPNAMSPSFEHRFARLEYIGDKRFNMAYMRHTGLWWQIRERLTIDQCLAEVAQDGPFTLFGFRNTGVAVTRHALNAGKLVLSPAPVDSVHGAAAPPELLRAFARLRLVEPMMLKNVTKRGKLEAMRP